MSEQYKPKLNRNQVFPGDQQCQFPAFQKICLPRSSGIGVLVTSIPGDGGRDSLRNNENSFHIGIGDDREAGIAFSRRGCFESCTNSSDKF
jgi:hypothetical protein